MKVNEKGYSRYDGFIDAIKDMSIIVISTSVSVFSFLSDQPGSFLLASLTLLISILSTGFLVYKFAAIKQDLEGALARTRAILVIIFIVPIAVFVVLYIARNPLLVPIIATEVIGGETENIGFLMRLAVLVIALETILVEPFLIPYLMQRMGYENQETGDAFSEAFRTFLLALIFAASYFAIILLTAGVTLNGTDEFSPNIYIASLAFSLGLLPLSFSYILFEPLKFSKMRRYVGYLLVSAMSFSLLILIVNQWFEFFILLWIFLFITVAISWTQPEDTIAVNLALISSSPGIMDRISMALQNLKGRKKQIARWVLRLGIVLSSLYIGFWVFAPDALITTVLFLSGILIFILLIYLDGHFIVTSWMSPRIIISTICRWSRVTSHVVITSP